MSGENSKVIDLSFLTEEEERNFRATINKDLELQRAEELRLKYLLSLTSFLIMFVFLPRKLRDDVEKELENYTSEAIYTDNSVCARCGVLFGIITNTGAACPSCSEWVCKQDRCYSFVHTWTCTLCEKRM